MKRVAVKTSPVLAKMLHLPRKVSISVGVHAEEEGPHPNSTGQTISEIAERHELGIGVPRRSWLRGWISAQHGAIEDILTDFHAFFPQRTSQRLQASIQGWIRAGQVPGPPLQPRTVERKGHTRKLIDTEAFVSAIKAKLTVKK
jgi:hypothetical protein